MSEAELRAFAREVIREALAGRAGAKPASSSPERVTIANDGDLAAFVRRVVALLDDPQTAGAVRAGKHLFTLGPAASSRQAGLGASAPTRVELEGAVTEARLADLAGPGVVVLKPGAVMTPLARDRARALGLKIERIR